MKINFFEEFPTKTNLQKLKLITWSPCVIFLAAPSINDFFDYKKLVRNLNRSIEVGWWPILKNSYWVSPWSDSQELLRISKELEGFQESTKILIDLEPPIMKKSLFLFAKNSPSFWRNKKIIKALLEQKNGKNIEIFTAELSPLNNWFNLALEKLGLIYPQVENPHYKRLLMLYSSMPLFHPKMKTTAEKIKQKDSRIEIGLGVIAKGILGNEPLLPPQSLFNDLSWCKKAGFNEATIFRLGGLNQRYLEVIKKFL